MNKEILQSLEVKDVVTKETTVVTEIAVTREIERQIELTPKQVTDILTELLTKEGYKVKEISYQIAEDKKVDHFQCIYDYETWLDKVVVTLEEDEVIKETKAVERYIFEFDGKLGIPFDVSGRQ